MGYRDQISVVTFFKGDEKRDTGRLRVVMRAALRWPGIPSPLPCTVRDISATGAKILLPRDVSPPDEFDLLLVDLQAAVRVTTMWRRRGYAGVAFAGAPQPKAIAAA